MVGEKGRGERERDRCVDFKELAYVIAEAGKSKILEDQQAGDPGKSRCCSLHLKVGCWQNFLFLGGSRSFS